MAEQTEYCSQGCTLHTDTHPGSLNPFPPHSHFKYHTNNTRRYPVGAFLASFFHSQPSELWQNQTESLTLLSEHLMDWEHLVLKPGSSRCQLTEEEEMNHYWSHDHPWEDHAKLRRR